MNEQQRPSPAPPNPAPGSDAPEWLVRELQTLPPLPAPPGTWQRVQRRTVERAAARRVGRWHRTALALAACLLATLATVLLVGELGGKPQESGTSGVALRTTHPPPWPPDPDWPQLPLAARAEHLVVARIGSIDATLNRQLLQGNGARPALLRQRETLTESLAHIQRHRQQLLVRQVVY